MHLLISKNRLNSGLLGLLLIVFIVVAGCSTALQPIKTGLPPEEAEDVTETSVAAEEPSDEQRAEEVMNSVESINVVGDGDKILIETTGTVRYTVFKLSDPPRLIVDMPGVIIDKVPPRIDVDNYFIEGITAESYGGEERIGRVVIRLKDGIYHDVKSGENSILISLNEDDYESAAEQEAVDVLAEGVDVDEEMMAEPAEEKAAAKVLDTAKNVLKIESKGNGGKTVINVVADGAIENYNSFELDDPARVVVDLWGLDNSSGANSVKVGGDYIKAVRIGRHPDKLRLVFDAAGKSIPPYLVAKADNYLVLTFGEAVEASEEAAVMEVGAAMEPPVMKAAAPKAEEAAPVRRALAEEPKGVDVENVGFKKVGPKGRLTIVSSGPVEYKVKESGDKKTVVIDLKGATIPDRLVRTLDASRLDTPVASISSYQESIRPKEVRLLVKLKDKALYDVKALDGTISVDFSTPPAAPSAAKKGLAAGMEGAPLTVPHVYTGSKIDLDMMDAQVTDVLRLLAEVSNLNIIASDDVKGTISLRLKNVPWDQAFDIILKSKGLGMITEGNVVRVAPSAKIRQETEAALAAMKAQEKLEPLDIRYIPINYADAKDLEEQVKNVLTDRGSVTSEKRTNTLIIKDITLGLESAEDLISKLDTPIPQVLIEARIVEASTTFARDLGVQWGFDFGTGGNVSTQTSGATGVDASTTRAQTPGSLITIDPNDIVDYAVNLPASGVAGTLGALGFTLGKWGQNPLLLDLRLSAGESEGRLRTISRPRIVTLDNKEAKIEQGESIPFETTSAGGTATTFIDANLSLTVTPHITPDGSVLMEIKASRNSIGSFRTSSGEPSINKKESSTEVLVKDGETTVIGGIVVTDTSDTSKGIPLLKDIPFLGWLFKSKSVADTQTELLIFITPTIVKDKIVG